MSRCRKNIRLKGYDYSSEGFYFITICTSKRVHFFGHVINKVMVLNDIGEMAGKLLSEIPGHFTYVSVDVYIIMPDHLHMILWIRHKSDSTFCKINDDPVGSCHGMTQWDQRQQGNYRHNHINQFSKPIAGSLPVIINQYKAAVKRWCNKNNHPEFKWQSRFHDHIINGPNEYKRIYNYIIENPIKWGSDKMCKR